MNVKSRLIRPLLVLMATVLTAFAMGQVPSKAHWTSRLEPSNPKPGQRVEIVLDATIDKTWHIYSLKKVEEANLPTTITVKPNSAIGEIGTPTQSDPIKKQDPNFGKELELYEEKASFRVPVRLSKTATGSVEASVDINYQACNESGCLPPKTDTVPVKIEVSGAAVDDATPLTDVDKAKAEGIFSYLALAVVSGFVALLTPCVFPMIPITVSFFSKQKKQEDLKAGIKQALWFCGGIVTTFTALGVIVSLVFGAAGLNKFANAPVLNGILAVVFVGLAFSLFGFFEIGLPPALTNKLQAERAGFLAPVFMGLTFSLTSFTCTLPFVGAVLVSASKGDIWWPILGMASFSAAFSVPFFFLALFPSALSRLPKSGGWLATTKAYMGFIELAAAVKFLSSVDLGVHNGLGILTRPVYLALWAMIAVMAGAYMVGMIKLPKVDEGPKIGIGRRLIGVASIAGAGYLLFAINGASIGELEAFLPPSPYPSSSGALVASNEKLSWLATYDAAEKQAKAENKPVFIDFTGVYCTNCRWMEKNMFPKDAIESRLGKFVRTKLFTDRPSDSDKANQEMMIKLTGAVTLPAYVIVLPDGKNVVQAFTRDQDKFQAFLDKGLAQ